MKFNKLRERKTARIMVIPMIDIIFFLLVFFMMSTLYMVEQHTIPVNLPYAFANEKEQFEPLAITITAQGSIFVNQTEVTLEVLPTYIAVELSRNPQTKVVLRGDRQVEYGKVIGLLDQLKRCGVQHISVATEVKPWR